MNMVESMSKAVVRPQEKRGLLSKILEVRERDGEVEREGGREGGRETEREEEREVGGREERNLGTCTCTMYIHVCMVIRCSHSLVHNSSFVPPETSSCQPSCGPMW